MSTQERLPENRRRPLPAAAMRGFFGPFADDYWIIGLDEKAYSWALAGHPSRRFLRILSKQPRIAENLYQQMVGIAVQKSYRAKLIAPSLLNQPLTAPCSAAQQLGDLFKATTESLPWFNLLS